MLVAKFYGERDIRLEDVPEPVPRAGEALIEVHAAGICGSDLHRYRGQDPWGGGEAGPRTFGHELSGVVISLGPGTDGVRVGQKVAVEPMQLAGCGACRVCLRGGSNLCPRRRPGVKSSAGFGERDVAAVAHLYPIAANISLEAAALTDLYACAIHAAHRVPVGPAATALILGSGPMALALGQVVRLSGTRTILAGRRKDALELAMRAEAADAALDASTPGFAASIADLTNGEGADVVFEAVGGTSGETLKLAIQVVSPGGTVGVVGAFLGDVPVPYRIANRKEVTLRWSNGYGVWNGRREFQMALDWIADGHLDAASLISHRYPLPQIVSAFETAVDKARSGAMKVMVLPAGGCDG
jgi:threonine dehydrogenase-like Zn-dependent dehydrogenase